MHGRNGQIATMASRSVFFYISPVNNSADEQGAMTARDKIEAVLDSIRPALRSDGGDVEFIDYDEEDGIVQLRLVGACGTCPVSTMTLKQGIERRIILAVPEVKGIHAL